jgi:hypothetical protein
MPKPANLCRRRAGAVELGHAHTGRHGVLVICSADDRRLRDQAEGGEARPRLLDPRRSRRALAEDEGKGLFVSLKDGRDD